MADVSTVTDPVNKRATEAQGPPWWALAAALAGAIVLLLVYSLTAPNSSVVFAVELIAGLTALVGGLLLGFLFGIPRTPQRSQSNGGSADGATDSQNRQVYEPSNNLEQVSDWLTKILVGAGLVQLEEMRDLLNEIGTHVGTAVGGAATGVVTQLTLLVFGILGFLGGFLWTRVYYGAIQVLADLRVQADLDVFASRIAKSVQATVEQHVEQKVQDTVVKVEDAVSRSEQAASTAGKLVQSMGQASVPTPVPRGGAAPVPAIAPDLAQKIEAFRNEPAAWNTDPVEKIFGGNASAADGLVLKGSIDTVGDDSLIMTLRVEGSSQAPIDGPVTFLLHPLAATPVRTVTARNNAAETTFYSKGWFHAAAIVNGKTALVLDLRTVPGTPAWFNAPL